MVEKSKLKFLKDVEKIDYKKIGLMCGIEIHQQLNCGKLFCSCPCDIIANEKLDKQIERRLRFSLSETGEVDKAALEEFSKGKSNIYIYNNTNACLVDLDEEPPNGPNEKAFSTAVRMGLMCNLTFFDKAQFMRKLIINGSVTSGFQRTAILGIGGSIKTSFGKVEIEGVNIEEDSCRIIDRKHDHNIYALDRQGIPLIEVTTGPQIRTPQQAYETAYQIGNMLRSFPETKRGLGTIRQDVNVSIKGGTRVEIKGAQNLKLIPEIVKSEIRRQEIYLSILDELKNRDIDSSNFCDKKIIDVSSIFKKTTSKVILSNLEDEKSCVCAIKLNGFKDILGHELHSDYRFASEVSTRNKKSFPTIKGLFHLDELPKYGIVQKEVEGIIKSLKISDLDNFILLAGKESIIKKSLKNIIEIIKLLISGVPAEVRKVDPKGTLTKYSRKMPGSARMYPETDISDIIVSSEFLSLQKNLIPELYNKKIDRLKKSFGISEENKVNDVLDKFSEKEFVKLLKTRVKSSQIYQVVFDLPKEIRKREKIDIFDFDFDLICDIVSLLAQNKLNKNSLYKVYVSLYESGLSSVSNFEKYLKDNNLIIKAVDTKEIEKKIKELVGKNSGAPFGAIMGICMKEFKGQVDGKIISEVLRKLV